jgi:hypothetical protein
LPGELTVLFTALGGASSGVGIGTAIVKVASGAVGHFRRRARLHADVDAAKQVLGMQHDTVVAYNHDSLHDLSVGTLHPDNLAALIACAGNDYVRAKGRGTLTVLDAPDADLDQNLVLIGSPLSDGLSRVALGYTVEPTQELSLALTHPPVELPYHILHQRGQIHERATVKRYVSGRGLVERPNWRVWADNRIYVPETDSEGMIAVDYLLVTRLRNYLVPDALDLGRSVLLIAGSHGTGTRGIKVLLRDRSTLQRIALALRDRPAAYQMLLRVGGMRHDRSAGSWPTKVELVEDPVRLPDGDAVWRAASSIASSNLATWRRSRSVTQ